MLPIEAKRCFKSQSLFWGYQNGGARTGMAPGRRSRDSAVRGAGMVPKQCPEPKGGSEETNLFIKYSKAVWITSSREREGRSTGTCSPRVRVLNSAEFPRYNRIVWWPEPNQNCNPLGRTSRRGSRPSIGRGCWVWFRISMPLAQKTRHFTAAASLPLLAHPHMLRHACGFALADQCADTRLIQDYLGHPGPQYRL